MAPCLCFLVVCREQSISAAHEGLDLSSEEKHAAEGKRAGCNLRGTECAWRILACWKAGVRPAIRALRRRLQGAEVSFDPGRCTDGNVTTSRGMGTAIPFALALTEQLDRERKGRCAGKGHYLCGITPENVKKHWRFQILLCYTISMTA